MNHEQKAKFFEVAVEKSYISPQDVNDWHFLSLEEFYHNGLMQQDHFREVYMEVFEEIPEEFSDKTAGTESDIDLNLDIDLDIDVDVSSNPPANKTLRTFPTGTKPSTSAFKQQTRHKRELSSPTESENAEKSDESPPIKEVAEWRKESYLQAEARMQQERELNSKLTKRTTKDLEQQRWKIIRTSAIVLLALNVLLAQGLVRIFLSLLIGGAAGNILFNNKGSGSFVIFPTAYLSNFVLGEIIGVAIFQSIFLSYAGVGLFVNMAAGLMLYTIFGRVLSRHLESMMYNYY